MKLSKQQKAELKQKYDGNCAYCGNELDDSWQADHLEPVVRYKGVMQKPENDCYENLVPACKPCNNKKSSLSIEGFRKDIAHTLHTINTGKQYASHQHAKRFGLVAETDIEIVFYFEKYEVSSGKEKKD